MRLPILRGVDDMKTYICDDLLLTMPYISKKISIFAIHLIVRFLINNRIKICL